MRKDKATEEDTAETQEIGAEVSPGRMRDLNPKIEWVKDRTDPPVRTVVGKTTNLANASCVESAKAWNTTTENAHNVRYVGSLAIIQNSVNCVNFVPRETTMKTNVGRKS